MQKVKHNVFGIGEIITKEIRDNDIYLTVKFSNGTEKKFSSKSFELGVVHAFDELNEEIEEVILCKKALEEKKHSDFIVSITPPSHVVRHAPGRDASPRVSVEDPLMSAFESHLIDLGYSTETPSGHRSTVYAYSGAIERNVLAAEGITWQGLKNDIDNIIEKYDVGGPMEHVGKKSNSTVIDALKQFREFVK